MNTTDQHWMNHALTLARQGAAEGEVPVGAVLVRDGEQIAEAWNRPIGAHDPTAHAEVLVLRDAGRRMENYRLPGTTLYVTLEPCPMCAGALVWARVERLVFAAFDTRGGAVASRHHLLQAPDLNHQVLWQGGLMAETSAKMLREFFRTRRRPGNNWWNNRPG
jgi:tRNA(adenine34) deaminase